MALLPAFCLLLAASVSAQQYLEVIPPEAVVRVGATISMTCRVAGPIQSCRIQIKQDMHSLSPGSSDKSKTIMYNGRGFAEGECGVTIMAVDESMHGNISCFVPGQNGDTKEARGDMKLIIAKPPNDPILSVSPGTLNRFSYKEGDTLQAQCIAANGRPKASIRWYIGKEQTFDGLSQAVITPSTQRLPGSSATEDLVTISQNLTRRLQEQDAGKQLSCQVEHQAWDSPRTKSVALDVQYPPKGLERGPITIFGIKLGYNGALNVTFRAHPPPSVVWKFKEGDQDETLGAGTGKKYDSSGRIEASEPIFLGNGFYNATLFIADVEKEDVERTYNLEINNGVGAELFEVRISTMDEPAGVELDAGAIVGIVIAVIVLLAIVSIIVFAKATHRWCFEGASHRTDLPDGADSEAPLPHHDLDVGIKGSENPAHLPPPYISNDDEKQEKKPDTAV